MGRASVALTADTGTFNDGKVRALCLPCHNTSSRLPLCFFCAPAWPPHAVCPLSSSGKPGGWEFHTFCPFHFQPRYLAHLPLPQCNSLSGDYYLGLHYT